MFDPVGVSLHRFLPSPPLRVRRRHLLPPLLLCLSGRLLPRLCSSTLTTISPLRGKLATPTALCVSLLVSELTALPQSFDVVRFLRPLLSRSCTLIRHSVFAHDAVMRPINGPDEFRRGFGRLNYTKHPCGIIGFRPLAPQCHRGLQVHLFTVEGGKLAHEGC